MKEIAYYKEKITGLASLLEKLHKVLHHPDPSADEKKKLLYGKYQKRMAQIAQSMKSEYSWEVIRDFITNIKYEAGNHFEDDRLEVVIKKLLKDFQEQTIQKPAYQEFNQPDPEAQKNIEVQKVTIRKYRKVAPKIEEPQEEPKDKFTKEQILKMVKKSEKQREATQSLRLVIDAIKKIGPEKLESKIIQSVEIKKET
ncbi:MAG: hypothetical protein OEY59_12590 [Deltaproteobacteria bacterium]|nr:hypothetical protein [Deltaproteobacteria bacterium]